MAGDKYSEEFNLSTLNLPAGTHIITVKAKASGYEDSEMSNEVSYTLHSISGTWVFNKVVKQGNIPSIVTYYIKFTCNGVNYSRINHDTGEIRYGNTHVASFGELVNSWKNEVYRAITFDGVQCVCTELYEWLTTNAVRQTITFTIGGTTYTALSGMTWREWIESEYNTGDYYCLTGDHPITLNGVVVAGDDKIIAHETYGTTHGAPEFPG